MAGLPEVTEIGRVAIRPGDRLVVRLDRHPDQAGAAGLRRHLESVFPGVPIAIIGPVAGIDVIGAEDPA